MILVRKVGGAYQVLDGATRLRATLEARGQAEVIDVDSRETLTVHEVAGRLVVLTEDGQRAVEQATDDVIARVRGTIPKTIWKFKLEPEVTLDMPLAAEILSVHAQGNEIWLWALVDPLAEKEKRRFVAFETGHDVPAVPLQFVGTALLAGGRPVFHVFEVLG